MGGSNIRGVWALVTGASSGLGGDFAQELARRGCNLILVARREELLQAQRQKLEQTYQVAVEVVALDLGAPEAPQQLYDQLHQRGREVTILINNAGSGVYGPFLATAWEQERQIVELNIIALVELTKLFARDMAARRQGYILQIASVASYQATPYYSVYAATKSFVRSFGEALHFELRGSGVSCTVFSPGITRTPFFANAGQRPKLTQRLVMMSSARVARIGMRAMLHRRPTAVAGMFNRLMVFFAPIIPRPLAIWFAELLMK